VSSFSSVSLSSPMQSQDKIEIKVDEKKEEVKGEEKKEDAK
jgi:hypothetical protein